jgi:uncharacterized protein
LDEHIKKPRGFAAMTPEQRRAASIKGVEAGRKSGKRHRWTSEEAKLYGDVGRENKRKKKLSSTDDAG